MKTIEELQFSVREHLKQVHLPNSPQGLYEPINYFFHLGGKRMRPVLLLLATDLFGGEVNEAISSALAVEIFHNFSLVHDDIMDKAPLRRSKPTVHTKWNVNTAILSGDAMLVKAYEQLAYAPREILPELISVFNKTALEVCEGQQFDMDFETQKEVSIPEYINMIRLKTAVLLGGALKMGGIIAHAATSDLDLIYQFGEDLGVAFQVQDDILDVFGDAALFGKQVGGDILSNKKTFLLLTLKEKANQEDQETLTHALTELEGKEKINQVIALYQKYDVRNAAELKMEELFQSAMKALASVSVDNNRKIVIQQLAENLMVREN